MKATEKYNPDWMIDALCKEYPEVERAEIVEVVTAFLMTGFTLTEKGKRFVKRADLRAVHAEDEREAKPL